MIEKIILDYLSQALDDPVTMEIPASPPERLYVLEKVGGGREDLVRHTMLALSSRAPSLYEAAQMQETAMGIMFNAAALDAVSDVKLNTEYNNTDTASKDYQYEAVYEITHY